MPLAAKLCIRPPNVLEVQERARGPLFHPPPGWRKNVEFLSVRHALSVHHAIERQSLFARFRHEDVGEQK